MFELWGGGAGQFFPLLLTIPLHEVPNVLFPQSAFSFPYSVPSLVLIALGMHSGKKITAPWGGGGPPPPVVFGEYFGDRFYGKRYYGDRFYG